MIAALLFFIGGQVLLVALATSSINLPTQIAADAAERFARVLDDPRFSHAEACRQVATQSLIVDELKTTGVNHVRSS